MYLIGWQVIKDWEWAAREEIDWAIDPLVAMQKSLHSRNMDPSVNYSYFLYNTRREIVN